MATATLCDGCAKVADSTEKVGLFQKFEYCDDCAVIVKEFLAERDQLHEDVAVTWANGLAEIVEQVRATHPDMKLPDV